MVLFVVKSLVDELKYLSSKTFLLAVPLCERHVAGNWAVQSPVSRVVRRVLRLRCCLISPCPRLSPFTRLNACVSVDVCACVCVRRFRVQVAPVRQPGHLQPDCVFACRAVRRCSRGAHRLDNGLHPTREQEPPSAARLVVVVGTGVSRDNSRRVSRAIDVCTQTAVRCPNVVF